MTAVEQVTNDSNRIIAIDFARGLSLLGILLINMMSFHSPFSWIDPYTYWADSLNHSFYLILDIFVGSSFYPLFSCLFGFGTVKIFERSRKLELNPINSLLRRFSLLLVIGIIHAFLVWIGDILIMYAITGMVLLLFLKLSPKIMTIIGGILLLVPNLLLALLYWVASIFLPMEEISPLNPERIEASGLYGTGSFLEITKLRIDEWIYINEIGGVISLFILILPMFLFGAAMAKARFIEGLSRAAFKKWGAILLVLGLSIKLIPLFLHYQYEFVYLQDSIGGPMVAMAYLFLCIGFIQDQKTGVVKQAIVNAGRMSLTVYLSQSILATILFYGYGFGLYGRVELWEGTILAIILYCLQLIFCYFWFKKYKMGPLERLWRAFTYYRKPSIK